MKPKKRKLFGNATPEEIERARNYMDGQYDGYDKGRMDVLMHILDRTKIMCKTCTHWIPPASGEFTGPCAINNRNTYDRDMCSSHPVLLGAMAEDDYFDWDYFREPPKQNTNI